jgi:hypothetical protein
VIRFGRPRVELGREVEVFATDLRRFHLPVRAGSRSRVAAPARCRGWGSRGSRALPAAGSHAPAPTPVAPPGRAHPRQEVPAHTGRALGQPRAQPLRRVWDPRRRAGVAEEVERRIGGGQAGEDGEPAPVDEGAPVLDALPHDGVGGCVLTREAQRRLDDDGC